MNLFVTFVYQQSTFLPPSILPVIPSAAADQDLPQSLRRAALNSPLRDCLCEGEGRCEGIAGRQGVVGFMF